MIRRSNVIIQFIIVPAQILSFKDKRYSNISSSHKSLSVTQSQIKYGPGFSHLLSSLQNTGKEEYEELFKDKKLRIPSTNMVKRNHKRLISGPSLPPEAFNSSRSKLAPLYNYEKRKNDSK